MACAHHLWAWARTLRESSRDPTRRATLVCRIPTIPTADAATSLEALNGSITAAVCFGFEKMPRHESSFSLMSAIGALKPNDEPTLFASRRAGSVAVASQARGQTLEWYCYYLNGNTSRKTCDSVADCARCLPSSGVSYERLRETEKMAPSEINTFARRD